MRITKQIAEDIVDKLVKKLTDRQKEIDKELGVILFDENMKRIPKEVAELYSKSPKYFNKTTSGYLTFLGRNIYVYAEKEFINTERSIVVTDPKIVSKLESLENERIELKKKIKSLHQEFTATIIKLGSTNKIIEHFPEAVPFLPEESLVPAINLTDTRNKLKEIL